MANSISIQLGDRFKSPIGTQYQVIEISHNKVKCLTLSGVFVGMVNTFTMDWVVKCMEKTSCRAAK